MAPSRETAAFSLCVELWHAGGLWHEKADVWQETLKWGGLLVSGAVRVYHGSGSHRTSRVHSDIRYLKDGEDCEFMPSAHFLQIPSHIIDVEKIRIQAQKSKHVSSELNRLHTLKTAPVLNMPDTSQSMHGMARRGSMAAPLGCDDEAGAMHTFGLPSRRRASIAHPPPLKTSAMIEIKEGNDDNDGSDNEHSNVRSVASEPLARTDLKPNDAHDEPTKACARPGSVSSVPESDDVSHTANSPGGSSPDPWSANRDIQQESGLATAEPSGDMGHESSVATMRECEMEKYPSIKRGSAVKDDGEGDSAEGPEGDGGASEEWVHKGVSKGDSSITGKEGCYLNV